MSQVFLITLIFALVLPAAARASGAPDRFDLVEGDGLTVTGPVELRLSHGAESHVEVVSGDWQVTRNGSEVQLEALAPTLVTIEASCLDKIVMEDGQLFIKVVGDQRLYLPEVSAPEIRLQLLGQARFDADKVAANHLLVALSEQGKASLNQVEAELLELDMTDHGDFNVAGSAKRQQLELSGYSHYDGADLDSEDVTVALTDYSAGFIKAKNSPVVSRSPYTSLSAL
jgi:hypothetical protein